MTHFSIGSRYRLYALAFAACLPIAACSPPKAVEQDEPKPPVTQREEAPPEPRFKKPEYVRGIYMTAWFAGSTRRLDEKINLLSRTELNSLVIDVRDSGNMYWKNDIALAAEAGANNIGVVNPEKLMEKLELKGVYPIARIACFRDVHVPKKFPERAVNHLKGGLWKDRSGNTWLDPYNKKNWEYLAEIVDFALDQGFPEIQLDYVRFPSEGKASTQKFPAKKYYDNAEAEPTEVIAAFSNYIKERVHKRGAVLSADIFGIVSSGGGDQGIGQELRTISEPFDLICPMVYPSHFARGEYGIANPNASPYAIIMKSITDFREKLPNKKIRPWLQDFSLGVKYGKAEVQAQIKAVRQLGYNEYLLWNPQVRYTESAVVNTDVLLNAAKKEATAATPADADR